MMTDIETVSKTVTEFLQRILGTECVRVVGANKVGEAWEVEAEAFEESSFLKALGLPSRVRDKNLYKVKLNAAQEVESYERQGLALQNA
jgi:hypothetical protein